jgi:hypothetical protein
VLSSSACKAKTNFRVKVSGFWIGFGKLRLKASPLVREVLGLKFEASEKVSAS